MLPKTDADRRTEDPSRDPDRCRGVARAASTADPDGTPRRDDGRGKDEGPSKDDLYEEAKRLKIEGRSRMTREELVSAIRVAQTARKPR